MILPPHWHAVTRRAVDEIGPGVEPVPVVADFVADLVFVPGPPALCGWHVALVDGEAVALWVDEVPDDAGGRCLGWWWADKADLVPLTQAETCWDGRWLVGRIADQAAGRVAALRVLTIIEAVSEGRIEQAHPVATVNRQGVQAGPSATIGAQA